MVLEAPPFLAALLAAALAALLAAALAALLAAALVLSPVFFSSCDGFFLWLGVVGIELEVPFSRPAATDR